MIKFFNTLSKKKEIFKPLKKKIVNIFVCGPTVYDFAHLGHARTYLFFDAICKFLREKGYKVFYLENITDIDDKIIKRAQKEKKKWWQISRKFEKEYFKDMNDLKISAVTKYVRATSCLKEIISQVKRLLEKKVAYFLEDGIYYDISKFKEYGKLAKRTYLLAEDGVSRIDEAKGKKNKGDFCLWKFWSGKKEEPWWPSPFGKGRPGWHIEDTAITEKFFGPQYDIHGGARDLIFPHHEAEIAQMEVISGKKPMVKYWLHTGFLTIKGEKMSKSLGNFITIREFLAKESPQVLRMAFFLSHYRSPVDFSENLIFQAKKHLKRLNEFKDFIEKKAKNKGAKESKLLSELIKYLEDDFNTPKFFGKLFELINKTYSKKKITKKEAQNILSLLNFIEKVFALFWEKEKIPKKILYLVKKREKLRKEKKWQRADKIRQKIKSLGYEILDTESGPRIKKIR